MDFTIIKNCGIVPVIKIDDAADAVSLAKALLAGGINVMEITFRTQAAGAAIAAVAKEVPDMYVGAGTVLTVAQLNEAKAAGAKFIVSPGFSASVVSEAIKQDLPILPGVVTPSEIIMGLELGLTSFKFFPAENYGGINTIKALIAPFGNINFVPTGGINEKNVVEYWKLPKVLAIGGSFMAPENLIKDKNFEEITVRSKEAVALMKTVR